MNNATPLNHQPAVQAIYVTTEPQRRAFLAVDAVDDLHRQLGAYRALEQLTTKDKSGSDEGLVQLQRSDLATLLAVLNDNLEAWCVKAREAAFLSANGVLTASPKI